MDDFKVKGVIEQRNISPKMQEEIIVNIQNRTEHGNKKEKDNFSSNAVCYEH